MYFDSTREQTLKISSRPVAANAKSITQKRRISSRTKEMLPVEEFEGVISLRMSRSCGRWNVTFLPQLYKLL